MARPAPLALNRSVMAAPDARPAGTLRAGNGLGSLVDADMTREMAQLKDLHNRQSRVASASAANRTPQTCTPQTLQSLFGNA